MIKLFVIFGLFLTSFVSFGQTLNDTINFDKLNINLINTEVFKKINEIREHFKSDLYVKDTVPTWASMYHMTYFKQHKELCDTHKYEKAVYTDLYSRGYMVGNICQLPEHRLIDAELYVNHFDYNATSPIIFNPEYKLIKQITKSHNIGLKKITYDELISLIVMDLYLNEKLLFYPNINQVHFGLWNQCIKNHNKDIVFAICFVLTEKI